MILARLSIPRTPRILASIVPIALLGGALLVNGCAIPHGSLARPVKAVQEGGDMISFGAIVPFAAAGAASTDDISFSGVTEDFTLVPAGAFDYALGERNYFGVELSLLNQFTSTADTGNGSTFGLFVNPRWELGLTENFSITIDGNLGYFQSEGNGLPFFAPNFGIRNYLPLGFGGFIWSQQIGPGGVVFGLPGSLAYDIPIPLGSSVLHLFPEFRYDPNIILTSAASGIVATFSGGLTVMLELE